MRRHYLVAKLCEQLTHPEVIRPMVTATSGLNLLRRVATGKSMINAGTSAVEQTLHVKRFSVVIHNNETLNAHIIAVTGFANVRYHVREIGNKC
jgi:hypothetical protein